MYQEILVLHVPQADKKAAPVLEHRSDLKTVSPRQKTDNTILAHPARRVNRLLAMVIGAAVTAPYALALAWAERGYLAVGGEVFLIALGAAVGGWLADHWGGDDHAE